MLDLPLPYRKAAIAFASVAVIGLGARSAVRSSDWISPEVFYQRTLASGGTSTRVSVNLGQIYSERGEYAKAEAIFRKILLISPDYPIARNNLAEVLYHEGKSKEAQTLFASAAHAADETRKEYPRTWIAALNLAHVRHKDKDDKAAMAIIEKARADYPHTWELISFEAELVRELKGPDAALVLVQNFTRDNWWHYPSAVALGRLLAEKGATEQACAELRHASWLDVHDVAALNLIALMRMRQNRLEDAFSTQRCAVSRQPDEPRQYLILSNILEKMGRGDEARDNIAQVERLQALAHEKVAVN